MKPVTKLVAIVLGMVLMFAIGVGASPRLMAAIDGASAEPNGCVSLTPDLMDIIDGKKKP